MANKKILILGAGGSQLDAILYCKDKGMTVVGCSYTNTDEGIPYLDHFRQVDIKDVDGVARLARDYDVDVIYSVGSDIAMPTVMKASELLGLPHYITSEAAELCHTKHRMRERLGQDFEGNVSFTVSATVDEAVQYKGFPGMMKPVDSQGQRGCVRVDSAEDIRRNFDRSIGYSREGKVIIESFIEGPEISVNGFLQDGKMAFAIVSDRHIFEDLPGGIIQSHTIPSTATSRETQAEAIDLTYRVARKVGIDNGPCYCQIKVDADGHPHVLEITPRLDGCHMWRLIKHYCGVDLLDACFQQLLTGAYDFRLPAELPQAVDELEFLCMPPDVPFDRSGFDVSGADYVCWYYENGANVHRVNGFMEKCGYVIRRK